MAVNISNIKDLVLPESPDEGNEQLQLALPSDSLQDAVRRFHKLDNDLDHNFGRVPDHFRMRKILSECFPALFGEGAEYDADMLGDWNGHLAYIRVGEIIKTKYAWMLSDDSTDESVELACEVQPSKLDDRHDRRYDSLISNKAADVLTYQGRRVALFLYDSARFGPEGINIMEAEDIMVIGHYNSIVAGRPSPKLPERISEMIYLGLQELEEK